MPFCDAIEQFAYWKNNPPLHLMVKAFMGIESGSETVSVSRREEVNPMEQQQAVQMLSGGRRARKLSQATPQDQERFAHLKEQMKNAR